MRPRQTAPEKIIQKQILNFLAAYGIFVFRVNTTGVFDPSKKIFRRLAGFNLKGVADILGVLPNGRFLAIEVKTAVGKQSIWQKNFQKQVESNNGVYVLARSIDDVRFIIDQDWHHVA